MPILTTLGAACAKAWGFTSGLITDQYFNLVSLLLPGNGTNGAQNNTFLDSSSNNFTITRNGNTTQGTFSPFSQTGWGNYFDGTDDQIVTTQTGIIPATATFTIECWVYCLSYGDRGIICQSTGGAGRTIVALNSSGQVKIQIGGTEVTTTDVIGLNTWTHIAITRITGTGAITIFFNGVSKATGTNTTSIDNVALTIGRTPSFSQYWLGYISNVRIVNGVQVYTGAFTPPTSPLTATQAAGTNINAITGSQTSLLTCQSNRFLDNAVTPNTLTPSNGVSVVAFSPFAPTAAYTTAAVGGSGYFDGTGDYLTVNNTVAIGAGSFTMECWVYLLGTPSVNYWIYGYRNGANTSPYFYITSSRTPVFGGDITTYLTGSAIPINTWTHIAVVRDGTAMALYQNGVSTATTTTSQNFSYTGSNGIGRSIVSTVYDYYGYITDFRIAVGTAVYTGEFTPPIAPITNAGSTSAASYPSTTNVNTSFASSDTSLLLNFTNAGITDATAKNDLETVGNAQISTTQSKWGGSSISFDGTGDWLLIPDQPQQRIGTGNFTIEMWVYRNASGTYGLVGKGTGTTGWLVSLNSSNQVVFTYGSSTITSTGTVSATTWTYIAVVREGTGTNQTKIYINGTNDGTGTVNTDFNQTNSMYIGADRTGGSAANAYVQDVRITNYARTITASPTAPFPVQ